MADLLHSMGSGLEEFPSMARLQQENLSDVDIENIDITEYQDSDPPVAAEGHAGTDVFESMNNDQRAAFNEIMTAIAERRPQHFF